MKSKKTPRSGQGDLFKARLDQILNPKHPLFLLADQMDWQHFEDAFGPLFVEGVGRPGLPVRLIVGLHYLKYTFDESDESVVERFMENGYWQYFCGFEFFQHELPLDPSSLVRWRNRIGPEGSEELLKEMINTAKRKKLIKKHHLNHVNVDTTVQEKAIAFPTDARLYHKMRRRLVRAAKQRGINLRQSYKRKSKHSLAKQGSYSHARQMKRARKETRKLRTFLGCVMRDIRRKCPDPDPELAYQLQLAERVYRQQRNDKNKICSIHAPEVECISKGKVHKRYEFGCKVSVVSSCKDTWILGADALHGNPYDGHTLARSVEQAHHRTGWNPKQVFCDRGYRGAARSVPEGKVHLSRKRKKSHTRSFRKWLNRRSAIEPAIGHLKSDNRLERNHLKGKDGDRMNAMFAASGYNLRKLLRAFLRLLFGRTFFAQQPILRVIGQPIGRPV